jgi:hypothetical protein
MKKIAQALLVSCGFIIAIIAGSSKAEAQAAELLQPEAGGSCVEKGDCGTTAGGVKLIGFWRESPN